MSDPNQQPIGVVLLNLGGPDTLEAVEPFLVNLFSDPDILAFPIGGVFRSFLARWIAGKRAEKVRGYYAQIGGGSPILTLTRQQAAGLERRLRQQGNFRVFIAMRYWHPLTEETVKEIRREGISRVVLVPLYPQYSKATTGSSFKAFDTSWKMEGGFEGTVLKIDHWHGHPSYIRSLVLQIREGLKAVPAEDRSDVHLVFSAHGIPLRLVRQGDPYQIQTEETVRLVVGSLGLPNPYYLSYQSRVGPLKWLGPPTDALLRELAEKGVKHVFMIPISFVSDHSETLYEMDILYKTLGGQLGFRGFYRMPSLNDAPAFLDGLSEIVREGCAKAKWV